MRDIIEKDMTVEQNVPQGTSEPSTAGINGANSGETAWYYDAGIPGAGPRPDWLDGKYNCIADQAKAAPGLRKALGAMSGAPEKYDLEEFKEVMDVDNPHVKGFLDYAKENKLNQDAVSMAVKSFVEYERSLVPDPMVEAEKLGPDGTKTLDIVSQWVKNELSPEAQELYNLLPKQASVIATFDELRQLTHKNRTQIPSAAAMETPKRLTKADVTAKMHANPKRYMEDASFRAEIQRDFELVLGAS